MAAPVLKARFGQDHWLVVNTLIWIANLESMRGKQGDHAVRARAAEAPSFSHEWNQLQVPIRSLEAQ